MTNVPEDIREIDLMAYADGLLESDANRKAAVEAYLEANPAEAARVEVIIEDNRAIRELHAAELGRPVPQRLLRAVREPERGRHRLPVAIAASVVLTALAAAGGWLIGQRGDGAGMSAELLHAVARYHVEPGIQTAVTMPADGREGGTLLPDRSRTVLIEVPAPDLSVHGFDLAERSLVAVAGQQMVRLVYRSSQGTMNLFMGLRRNANTTAIRHIPADDVSVLYWSEGPLAFALTSDAQEDETARLAETVRGVVKPGRFVEPPPAAIAGQNESVAREDVLGIQQPVAPVPSNPQPSHFN